MENQIKKREALIEEKMNNDARLTEIKAELATTPPYQRVQKAYHDLMDERSEIIEDNVEITKELRLLADTNRESKDLIYITTLVSGFLANPDMNDTTTIKLVELSQDVLKTIKEELNK